MAIRSVAISAGHGKKNSGMPGILEEAEETPKVMHAVAEQPPAHHCGGPDQTSTMWMKSYVIVDWHNGRETRCVMPF